MNHISLDRQKAYLVTGMAGFIGFYLAKRLLDEGCMVVGIDNMNDYYDTGLKQARLNLLIPYERFRFVRGGIENKELVFKLFKEYGFDIVINLAAQAGVRYSVHHPDVYIQSNIVGFFNIIEACRHYRTEHLVYASSSSVYGANKKIPFEEIDAADTPVSLYAATKKADELMAYAYSHLYGIPSTGLRFFTVYGPFGRPDMSYFQFTDKYFRNEPIRVFNNGDLTNDLYRDFTYVDDIIEGMARIIANPPSKTGDEAAHRVFNIGSSSPVKLMDFINTLEWALSKVLGRPVEFERIYEPLKPGDVRATYASSRLLQEATGYRPSTLLKDGLLKFAEWYKSYYNVC